MEAETAAPLAKAAANAVETAYPAGQLLARDDLYSKIIPPENSGEYFGIYDIFCKGASFLGSAVIAWVKLAGGTINIAVASLAIFFALGFLFLIISSKQKSLNRASNE